MNNGLTSPSSIFSIRLLCLLSSLSCMLRSLFSYMFILLSNSSSVNLSAARYIGFQYSCANACMLSILLPPSPLQLEVTQIILDVFQFFLDCLPFSFLSFFNLFKQILITRPYKHQ